MSTTPGPIVEVTLPATLEFSRPGIAAADADAAAVPRYLAGPWAQAVRVGARCSDKNCTLAARVYFLDSSGMPLGVVAVQFYSGGLPDWGGQYIATASVEACWPLAGAKAVALKVDAINGAGTWTLAGAMA